MIIVLWALYITVLSVLLLVLGAHPQPSSHSLFELKRRIRSGDEEARLLLRRHSLSQDLLSLQRVASAVLIVIASMISVKLFHWVPALFLSVLVALGSGMVAKVGVWRRYAQRIYEQHEGRILAAVERYAKIFKAIMSVAPMPSEDYGVESKEELISIVEKTRGVLSRSEKQLIINSLKFEDMTVGDIMTPRSVVDTVAHDEVLGPLALDGLYKTGHSRFPVVVDDIDHVAGVLYVRDLLVVSSGKNSRKAREVMDEEVCFIHMNQDLAHALRAFIKTEKMLFVVVNNYRETVGVLTLEDVIEAMLGQKINDEFEYHTNLRAVAEQNLNKNNSPVKARDV